MINRAAEVNNNKYFLTMLHHLPVQALVELIDEDDLARRATFPENVEIREIACHLASKVFEQAVNEGLQVSVV